MVKIRAPCSFDPSRKFELDAWLLHLKSLHDYEAVGLIRQAAQMASVTEFLPKGVAIAEILADMHLDQTALAAGLLFHPVQSGQLSLDDITKQLNPTVTKLIQGISDMQAINQVRGIKQAKINHQTLDNLRKMLITMTDDARVVVIKLAERLVELRPNTQVSDIIRHRMAIEAREIYAPLASRLGIGHIKWEMEDLSFRYLAPDDYKAIARGLKERRAERDHYVNNIMALFSEQLNKIGLENFEIFGRSKHIHSIHRKMLKKHMDLNQIYDATAIRVIVASIDDCYQALSRAHALWQPIPEEFDDYIAHPKPNGYQSLHTAVIGPEGKAFEVQIRTRAMHDAAEKGVAAHWRYKEPGSEASAQQGEKIQWLREVLAWQQDIADQSDVNINLEQEFFQDRIYVFTPQGDVLDLPIGATPLDFAYTVHTMIGHRCKGAKINQKISSLTYPLKTGDQIEILTQKDPSPSRDWLNPHLGYLKTPRARAKVMQWFKRQDHSKNAVLGKQLLQQFIKKSAIPELDLNPIIKKYNYQSIDDLHVAIGCGDVTLASILAKRQPAKNPIFYTGKKPQVKIRQSGDVVIEGLANLLTNFAQCCQPIPGDEITAYVTLGRGITIHRSDCQNLVRGHTERQLAVEWTNAPIP